MPSWNIYLLNESFQHGSFFICYGLFGLFFFFVPFMVLLDHSQSYKHFDVSVNKV